MQLTRPYSYCSFLLAVVGFFAFILSYAVSPDYPQGIFYGVIYVLFYGSIAAMFIGMVLGLIAIFRQENGKRKYVGVILPIGLALFLLFIPLIMAGLLIVND